MQKPLNDVKPLLRYFVDIFKLHVTGDCNSPIPVRVIPVVEKTVGESIYEFKIRYRSAWKSRRMSIESLGEKVESKSTCYKVIYDDMLVIKIPPRPITDFNAYLDHINREHAIARRIQKTIPCVYPQLGAILKKIPLIRLASYVRPEDSEQEYINLLQKHPSLQHFLKIGDGFVFFMTLSKYQFFNQVIDSIHHVLEHTRQEIAKNGPEAISDLIVFESLYGANNDRIYYEMNAFAESYNKAIEKILQDTGFPRAIPDFRKQEWLFTHLAGLRGEIDPENLPKDICDEIEEKTRQLVGSKRPVMEEFRKLVHKIAKDKNFNNNRQRVKGLIINILELLYHLKNRHTAIRDLKPDNIYVAAFLDGADHVLANPAAYDLGLIDLETALCFKPGKDGRFEQPLLAGTPSYATPSHIFGNRILRAVYKNELSRIFFLQDMQAAMVMIFKVLTGRTPFVKTSRLMPEISRLKKKNLQNFENLHKVYQNANRRFWKTAIHEFAQQVQKYKYRLEDVEIELPRHLKKFLAAEYKHELMLMGQSWDKNKGQYDHLALRAIEAPIQCDFLVEFLFNRVFFGMNQPEWEGEKKAIKETHIPA